MTLSRQWAALFGLILLLAAAAAPRAGGTRFFRVDDFRHAPGLELRGVAVSNGGGLVPGLQATPLAGPSLPIIWKAVASPLRLESSALMVLIRVFASPLLWGSLFWARMWASRTRSGFT